MSGPDKTFFAGNRERVYDALRGGILLVPAYAQMQRSNDTAYRFEQEANFWYLTGINYPDWWLLMDGKRRRSWLVAPNVEAHHELFDGSLSRDNATVISGITDIIDVREADSWLRQAARTHPLAYVVDVPHHAEYFGFTMNPVAREAKEKLARIFTKVEDFRLELSRLRVVKQPAEINAIQSAIDLTVNAFDDIKSRITTYRYEYEIEADFTHYFRKNGADGHAYDPIVAAGENACTLHYIHNNSRLKKGQLLLLDIGAKCQGYAADITRTYAYGTATKRQRQVHEAVAEAQRDIIGLIEPDLPFEDYYQLADTIMQKTLMKLGLISSMDSDAYRRYFPHAIGHGLGIDVHDSLGKLRTLQPGMIITVEPGIYIPEEKIGVRIEDDILVTKNGHKNMSEKLSTAL
jgi:Xaa-Pro aminopeptidase